MIKYILWIDDIRNPYDYFGRYNGIFWCKSVNEAIDIWNKYQNDITDICLDHDAGDYQKDGGDYIKFLDWLEEKEIDFTKYKWYINSMNPVGVQNILAILRKNGVKL